jgi:hypothetical protein
MKQAPPVKSRADLVEGRAYYLSELPNGIKFLCNGKLYETLTYPPYNTINLRHVRRPCFNLNDQRTENLLYGKIVVVVSKN